MFSRFFIYHPIFASVISILIVIVGLISIPLLPIESMPDITPPTVEVSATYPGAGATVVADAVTAPLEEKINGVEGMIYMTSKSSSDGSSTIQVTFEVGTDVDMANVLVQNRVSEAEPTLPEEVKKQGVRVKKKSTSMTLMINMVSPGGTYDELYISNYTTTRIKDMLARIPGVSEVQIMGAKDFGMRIWLDPIRLKGRGLTTLDIIDSLREQNVQVAAGQIGGTPSPADQPFQYSITTLGRLESVEQFENVIVKTGEDGRLVRIKNIARVELGAQSYQWNATLDGAPSIAVAVYQLPEANALEVAQSIRAVMDRLAVDFPADFEYRILYDTTEYILQSIKEVTTTLIVAMALVIFTVYIFLQDFRTTLVPAITIPVSLLGTFAVMLALGLSINALTMFGLILVIGIVVDDAIVVVENTLRLINDEGLDPKAATAKSMVEITGPVVATTLVLLAVFVPTIVMPGITGRLYRPFAITISVATVFSSINALTLSPALCGMLLRPSKERTTGFWGLFNRTLKRSTSGYAAVVRGMMRKTALAGAVFLGLMVASYFGITSIPTGFVPSEDEGYLMVAVQLPDAASLGRTEKLLEQVYEVIARQPGVRGTILISGYSLLDGVVSANAGAAWVVLDHWDDRSSPETRIGAIVNSLNRNFASIRGAIAFAVLPPPIRGLGTVGGFEMQVQDRGGAGLRQLQESALDLVDEGGKNPVLTALNSTFRAGVPQIYVDVDRVKAKRLGIPLSTIFNTLQVNLGSAYVNDFNLFGRTWKVYVQADEPYRIRREHISQLEVRAPSGKMVPLSTLVEVSDTVGPTVLKRHNLFAAATVTGDAAAGFSSGQAVEAIAQTASNVLPPSMGFEWSGVTFQEQSAGGATAIIFGMALVFVYLFLAAQYESWMLPMSVMLSVPLAILGAALATLVRGLDNNVYTQIGLVLLIGLSAKTAILIVEFANQQREQGKSAFDAALTAATLRFRPILMTAFSFILGVMPLLIATGAGAVSRRALGTAVFGGMLLATVAGIFFIPFLYYVVQRARDATSRKRVSGPTPEPEAG